MKAEPSVGCSKSSEQIVGKGDKKRENHTLVKKYQAKMVTVSFYNLHGHRTSNGEIFDSWGMTTAHKKLPFNSIGEFCNPQNGRTVRLRVNDRGPFNDRDFDISKGAARYLGIIEEGVARLQVKIIYQPLKKTTGT